MVLAKAQILQQYWSFQGKSTKARTGRSDCHINIHLINILNLSLPFPHFAILSKSVLLISLGSIDEKIPEKVEQSLDIIECQALCRYRTPSATGGAIGRRYLALSQPPTKEAELRDCSVIVSKTLKKTSAKQKRDRGRDSRPRPRARLISQPRGATKSVRHLAIAWMATVQVLNGHRNKP